MFRATAFLPNFVALLIVLASHFVVSTPLSAVLARSKAVSEASFQLRNRAQHLARALGQELAERRIGSSGKTWQHPEKTLIEGVVELPIAPTIVQAARDRLAEESERLEEAERPEAEQHSHTEHGDKDVLAAFREYVRRAPPMVLIMPPSQPSKEENDQVMTMLGQGSGEEEPTLRGVIMPSTLPSMEDEAQALRIPHEGTREKESIRRSAFDVDPVKAPRRGRMLRREDVQKAVAENHVIQTQRPLKLLSSRLPTDLPPLTLEPVAVQPVSSSDLGKIQPGTETRSIANNSHLDNVKIAGNSATQTASRSGEEKRGDRTPTRAASHEEPSGKMQEQHKTGLTQDTATSVAKSVDRMVQEMHNIQQKLGPGALEDILREILSRGFQDHEPLSFNSNEPNMSIGSDKEAQGHGNARHRQALGEDTSSEIVVQGGHMVERKRKCRNGHCETWVISRESAKAPAIETEVDDEFPRSVSGPPLSFPHASVPVLQPFSRRHRSVNGAEPRIVEGGPRLS